MPGQLKPVAGLLLLLIGGLFLSRELARSPKPSPEDQRAIYEIGWKNFSANCDRVDAGANLVLATYCREAASQLERLPGCDRPCRAATSIFTGR